MASKNEPGDSKDVSPVLRVAAGILAIGALLSGLMMGYSWAHVAEASILFAFGAVGMIGFAGAFGYAAITGRTPMAPD